VKSSTTNEEAEQETVVLLLSSPLRASAQDMEREHSEAYHDMECSQRAICCLKRITVCEVVASLYHCALTKVSRTEEWNQTFLRETREQVFPLACLPDRCEPFGYHIPIGHVRPHLRRTKWQSVREDSSAAFLSDPHTAFPLSMCSGSALGGMCSRTSYVYALS